MSGAEPLTRADDRGQEHLGAFGCVIGLTGAKANIATSAVSPRPFLSQVLQQELAAAGGQGTEIQHPPHSVPGPLLLIIGFQLVDEIFVFSPVSWRVEQHALAGHSVAPSPASLLVIALNAFEHIVVDYQTHVRLIDTHSERDGCHDDGELVTDEAFLNIPPVIGFHSAMVGLSVEALLGQRLRGVFGRPS